MKRPHVLVNAAMTVDGKIDSIARQGAGISSLQDLARVDHLRQTSDAILVGGRTLLEGDPRLTIKSAELRQERITRGLPENPAKVGVISVPAIKPDSRFMTVGPARRLIYTTTRAAPEQIHSLQDAGAEVFVLGECRVDLIAMLASLYDLGIRQLMVEGGGTLIAGFINLALVDALSLYIAPKIFGGATAPSLVDGPGCLPDQALHLRLTSVEQFDEDGGILVHYTIQ